MRNSQLSTKKLKPSRRNLLKKLQNEKREAAEKALSEMKIKKVDLETLNKDIEDKEGEISDLKKKLEAEEDNQRISRHNCTKKEDDIADLEKQVKKLQNTISDVNAQNEDTGAVLNDTKDDTEKKLDQQVCLGEMSSVDSFKKVVKQFGGN
ncbi:hypothetical protein EIN_115890 [Entamoeba invadens IP1]|uniref:Uncharacterized protein n=1 Tax=Entamoeba invadens IP1 TaxID=370355 RepID=L7FP45_ENTIV|nr:hypothetical protein EIN_115890 [Entamoeba invadens IP1]ELP94518.1 hypothetical protein EIN_115890 [Entamoeba invadens IP1]|eukprot:XP_004261289.1 hypothetical protein EIN_115890 [Entamoeba invadens IP1]